MTRCYKLVLFIVLTSRTCKAALQITQSGHENILNIPPLAASTVRRQRIPANTSASAHLKTIQKTTY